VLEYVAGAGCPDEAAFRAQLGSRLSAPIDTWSTQSVRVEAAAYSNGARGSLVVVDRSGTAARRVVDGATCDEVVSALALMAVVLLEGSAERVPPPPSGAPEARPNPAPRRYEREPARTGSTVRWAAGLHGVIAGGVAPSLAPGLRGFGEVGAPVAEPFIPSLRLSFAWTTDTHAQSAVGDTRFSFLSGRAEACPLRFGTKLALVVCSSFDVGRVAGDTRPAGTGLQERLWLAPGVVLRLAWAATPFLDLELEGGATFPLFRYRFFVTPDSTVHQVPSVTGSGGLGLALRFP
jgi:hypothetical protein